MSYNQPQKLRKYAFRVPSVYISILLLVFFLILLYVTSYSLRLILILSITIFFITIFDYIVQYKFGFTFHLRRILFLLIISLYFSLIYYLIILAFRFLPPETAFMLSLTPIAFIRTMIYLTFTKRRRMLAHLTSLSFPLILSVIFKIFLPQFDIFILAYLLSSVIYSISADVFVSRSLNPFFKEFSYDPIKIIADLMNASYKGESYDAILGSFLSYVYNTSSTRQISLLKFENSKEFYFVFPYVHPGPLGELGSSNITGKFSNYEPGKEMLIFHTTTTHDDNCADDSDVKKLTQIFHEEFQNEYEYCYRPYFGEYSTFLPIGDGGILFIVPDKVRFDDILLSEGKKLINYAKNNGLKWLEVVDTHNNNMDKPVELLDVSFIFEELKKGIESRDGLFPILADYTHINYSSNDIGPGGVKLVKMKFGDKIVGIILFDGNNMDYNFRKKLESKITGVDKLIICTTDNHVVNVSGLSVNPVGLLLNHDELLEQIRSEFAKLEPNQRTKVQYVKKDYKLKLAGESHYEKLNIAIKRSISSAKLYIFLMLIFSIVFSIFIFKYLS